MKDTLALFTILFWMVIPLFWIPVHSLTGIFRRLGIFTYLMPLATWLPLAFLVYLHRDTLLHYEVSFHPVVTASGILLFAAGTALHIWTGRLLTLFGIIGVHEVVSVAKGRLVTEGAFKFVRHPTYLAHTIMFLGAFLATGVIAVGLVTLLDFCVVNAVIIPLEERELARRFGREYEEYRMTVPRFFPWKIFRSRRTRL